MIKIDSSAETAALKIQMLKEAEEIYANMTSIDKFRERYKDCFTDDRNYKWSRVFVNMLISSQELLRNALDMAHEEGSEYIEPENLWRRVLDKRKEVSMRKYK